MSNVRGYTVHDLWANTGITWLVFHRPVLNNFYYPQLVRFFTNYPQPTHRFYPQLVRFFTSINRFFSTVSTGLTTISTTLIKLTNSFRKAR